MAESGCLKDGHFHNLQVKETTIIKKNVTKINTNTSLNSFHCGEILLGPGVGQTQTSGFHVKLPTPSNGLWYNFTLTAAASSDITIFATSDGNNASYIAVGISTVDGTNSNQTSNIDRVTFVTSSADCGDCANCFCDGTNWFFNIVGNSTGSVIFGPSQPG